MTQFIRRVTLMGLILVALLAANPRDSFSVETRRPNILFLLADDMRPDTIGALGNAVIKTPHLDALARGGTVFTRAVCGNPICTPSRAEILSGCSSFRNGVLDFGRSINAELARWPQTMRDAGYHTWFIGKWHNVGQPREHGFEECLGLFRGGGGKWATDQIDSTGSAVTGYRGWVFQTEDGKLFPEKGIGLTPDISAHFADAAIELIQRKTEKPWFLQVSFTAPHDPLWMPTGFQEMYAFDKIPLPKNFMPEHPFDHGNFDGRDEKLLPWPRTPELVRELIGTYYAVISHLDQEIGRVLAALKSSGQADRTIVIFSSDHGLGVGSHGIRGKQNMYEHTIGVPLVFHGAGIPRGQTRAAQVYLRDLFPTSCELAGIAIPKSVEGKSLAGVIAGDAESVYPHVFGYFRDKQRMIRTDRWKLIHYPHLDKYQLFDLHNDSHELNSLADDAASQAVVEELRDKLRAWQKEVNDPLVRS